MPYLLRASFTGWKKVVPPELQLPEPPEVRPMAVTVDVPLLTREPPESPGSAHTLVRIIWLTEPSAYRTVVFTALIVPQCQPVVEPDRQTAWPTLPLDEPVTRTSAPELHRSTRPVDTAALELTLIAE